MAFPELRRSQAAALEIGDELFIYTTVDAYNPAHDRSCVVGLALVRSDVRDLAESVVFGERRYTSGCTFVEIEQWFVVGLGDQASAGDVLAIRAALLNPRGAAKALHALPR